jgi:hypothetical protein
MPFAGLFDRRFASVRRDNLKKIFAIALFAASLSASAASAAGGAEPMPGTNYTDMPPYHPFYAEAPSYRPLPTCRTKRSCAYQWSHPQLHDR